VRRSVYQLPLQSSNSVAARITGDIQAISSERQEIPSFLLCSACMYVDWHFSFQCRRSGFCVTEGTNISLGILEYSSVLQDIHYIRLNGGEYGTERIDTFNTLAVFPLTMVLMLHNL